jgi:hypothetical protein
VSNLTICTNLFAVLQIIASLQVSISPIFYEQLFHTNVFCAAFYVLTIWQKDYGTKAAHKILVKLTPGCQNTQHNNNKIRNSHNSTQDCCADFHIILYRHAEWHSWCCGDFCITGSLREAFSGPMTFSITTLSVAVKNVLLIFAIRPSCWVSWCQVHEILYI